MGIEYNSIDQLQVGPRYKSQATVDLETVAKAFVSMNSPKPTYQLNRLGELEIDIGGQRYNLTKILEHQPDFEQLDIVLSAEEQAQVMKTFLAWERDVIRPKEDDGLSDVERHAIRIYTNTGYEMINNFLRSYGMKDSGRIECVLPWLAILPNALLKLREHQHALEPTELYRGQPSGVPHPISLQTECSFISTSQKTKPIHELFKLRKEDYHLISYPKHGLTKLGARVDHIAWIPAEQEILFLPGTQFIYSRNNNNNNITFSALPVRVLNQVDPFSYQSAVISLRTQLIAAIDTISKEPAYAPFMHDIDTHLARIAEYGLGTETNTIIACDTIRSLVKLPGHIQALLENIKDKSKTMLYAKHYPEYLPEHIHDAQWMGSIYHRLATHATYVYDRHLSQPFKDPHVCATELKYHAGDVTIQRPNHGLAHSIRCALYITGILHILRNHARSDELSQFILSIDHDQLELMQLAMLFSVTGRESEASFAKQKEKYREYRQASTKHFLYYINTHNRLKHLSDSTKMLYSELIECLGDPEYLDTLINGSSEKKFLCCILNLAHKLDLQRCYDSREYTLAMNNVIVALSPYLDDAFKSEGIDNALHQMTREAILATGDAIYSYDSVNYQPDTFIKASTNAQQCIIMCLQQVPLFSSPLQDLIPIKNKTLTQQEIIFLLMQSNRSRVNVPQLYKIAENQNLFSALDTDDLIKLFSRLSGFQELYDKLFLAMKDKVAEWVIKNNKLDYLLTGLYRAGSHDDANIIKWLLIKEFAPLIDEKILGTAIMSFHATDVATLCRLADERLIPIIIKSTHAYGRILNDNGLKTICDAIPNKYKPDFITRHLNPYHKKGTQQILLCLKELSAEQQVSVLEAYTKIEAFRLGIDITLFFSMLDALHDANKDYFLMFANDAWCMNPYNFIRQISENNPGAQTVLRYYQLIKDQLVIYIKEKGLNMALNILSALKNTETEQAPYTAIKDDLFHSIKHCLLSHIDDLETLSNVYSHLEPKQRRDLYHFIFSKKHDQERLFYTLLPPEQKHYHRRLTVQATSALQNFDSLIARACKEDAPAELITQLNQITFEEITLNRTLLFRAQAWLMM